MSWDRVATHTDYFLLWAGTEGVSSVQRLYCQFVFSRAPEEETGHKAPDLTTTTKRLKCFLPASPFVCFVFLCMCICVCVMYARACLCVCLCMCAHVYMHALMYVWVFVCMCVCLKRLFLLSGTGGKFSWKRPSPASGSHLGMITAGHQSSIWHTCLVLPRDEVVKHVSHWLPK